MVLLEFGLPSRMVDWIMICLSTVSYSILINGALTYKFPSKKRDLGRETHVTLPVCFGDGISK